ncbi:MAG: gfo/Idh/MocA family oxidoreductase [Candidatus Hydrogenedens sp.]|nr:gfo/Idh/MocA family oxidoreductase [Candidatus Hydrogenedens sp.]
MSGARKLRIALAGAGMFGQDVHLPAYSQLQRNGLAPWLGRLGLDDLARPLADVEIEFVALATRTEASGKARLAEWSTRGLDFALYHGVAPWVDVLDAYPDLDLLAVATPDNLHGGPTLAALERGVHVLVEKPMTLDSAEADKIVELAQAKGLLVGVDMHKRYDPDHLRIRDVLTKRIGAPLYGRAVLEEPLEISSQVFAQWAENSDPFSYVGCHWTDLYIAYLGVKPVSLHAVGQKRKLLGDFKIDTFDAVQVKVQFDNGMSIDFINNWIMPDGFEGPVNQESALYGTDGVIESDTQYRGLRYAAAGHGSRTMNTHVLRDVPREDGSHVTTGYGIDSVIACVAKVAEMKFLGKTREQLAGTYPTAEEGRLTALIVHAAREVCQANFAYTEAGKGAPVTALFNEDGITLVDPYAGLKLIYDRPV